MEELPESILCVTHNSKQLRTSHRRLARANLLVQGLGVGGGGRNVGITSSLVRASSELELVGGLEVGIAGGAVGGSVILEIEKKGKHCSRWKQPLVSGFIVEN